MVFPIQCVGKNAKGTQRMQQRNIVRQMDCALEKRTKHTLVHSIQWIRYFLFWSFVMRFTWICFGIELMHLWFWNWYWGKDSEFERTFQKLQWKIISSQWSLYHERYLWHFVIFHNVNDWRTQAHASEFFHCFVHLYKLMIESLHNFGGRNIFEVIMIIEFREYII